MNLPRGWTWEGVLARLGEHADIEQSARAFGAIKRVRVIKSGSQLLRLVLAYALSGLSLRSTTAWAEAAGEASFSDVALLKRLKGCGPWLAALVSQLSDALAPEAACGDCGRRIVAVDATTVCSPGGLHKSYRLLHTAYDVGLQRFRTTLVTDRKIAERLDIGTVERGEIRLGDRAYGRYRDLSAVTEAGADYIVRLSATALRLEGMDGHGLDRALLCEQAATEGVRDCPVIIRDTKTDAVMTARVIVLALPPEKTDAARRQMRKNSRKWGYEASEGALATAGCVMLITSLSGEGWPVGRVLELYRRRWQAELAFKRLKSLLDLETLRAFDSELVSAWIHALLIVALLIELERPSVETGAPDSPHWSGGDPYPCGASLPSPLAA